MPWGTGSMIRRPPVGYGGALNQLTNTLAGQQAQVGANGGLSWGQPSNAQSLINTWSGGNAGQQTVAPKVGGIPPAIPGGTPGPTPFDQQAAAQSKYAGGGVAPSVIGGTPGPTAGGSNKAPPAIIGGTPGPTQQGGVIMPPIEGRSPPAIPGGSPGPTAGGGWSAGQAAGYVPQGDTRYQPLPLLQGWRQAASALSGSMDPAYQAANTRRQQDAWLAQNGVTRAQMEAMDAQYLQEMNSRMGGIQGTFAGGVAPIGGGNRQMPVDPWQQQQAAQIANTMGQNGTPVTQGNEEQYAGGTPYFNESTGQSFNRATGQWEGGNVTPAPQYAPASAIDNAPNKYQLIEQAMARGAPPRPEPEFSPARASERAAMAAWDRQWLGV